MISKSFLFAHRGLLAACGLCLTSTSLLNAQNGQLATNLALAMDVPTNSLVSASFTHLADVNAAKVRFNWGVTPPFVGPSFAVISTGIAADENDPGYRTPRPGTSFSNSVPNPFAGQGTCDPEPSEAHDLTELQLVLNVPTNALGFSLKFNFFSSEYPENVCTIYNDRFTILLASQAFNGNVAFDSRSNAVSVNTAFFANTNGADLSGTGMENIGAAIGWQTVQSPVIPGETITLKLSIFDGYDGTNDSVAVIDAFDWTTNPPPPLTALIYPAVEIGWASQTNKNYQVEWASILNSNQWFNLGSPVAGNGSTNYTFDSTRGSPAKFYRVRQVP